MIQIAANFVRRSIMYLPTVYSALLGYGVKTRETPDKIPPIKNTISSPLSFSQALLLARRFVLWSANNSSLTHTSFKSARLISNFEDFSNTSASGSKACALGLSACLRKRIYARFCWGKGLLATKSVSFAETCTICITVNLLHITDVFCIYGCLL